jgi:hypothetical protein
MKPNQICKNCRYFDESKQSQIYEHKCRRNPPQIVKVIYFFRNKIERIPDSWDVFGFFPTISEDDWCGEWKCR